jgi:hypothetical protein
VRGIPSTREGISLPQFAVFTPLPPRAIQSTLADEFRVEFFGRRQKGRSVKKSWLASALNHPKNGGSVRKIERQGPPDVVSGGPVHPP